MVSSVSPNAGLCQGRRHYQIDSQSDGMHTILFSHSRLSKYFVELIDFIMKAEYMLSPLQRIRVLEGAFTNGQRH